MRERSSSAVSYTHLDVYKRQGLDAAATAFVRPEPSGRALAEMIFATCLADWIAPWATPGTP